MFTNSTSFGTAMPWVARAPRMWMSWALPREAATLSGLPSALRAAARAFRPSQSPGATGRSLDTIICEPPFTWPEIATTSNPLSRAVM